MHKESQEERVFITGNMVAVRFTLKQAMEMKPGGKIVIAVIAVIFLQPRW